MEKYRSFFIILLLFIPGCGVKFLGKVGDTDFYSVSYSRLDGPNFNALVSERDGKAHIESVFSGPGVITSISSSTIQAATLIDTAYIANEKKGTTINVDNGPSVQSSK